MSELKEFLTPHQIKKHYDVVAYLSQHINKEFTLVELDYYLPHGAPLMSFPLEWHDYMEGGHARNRNIELHRCSGSIGTMTVQQLREQTGKTTLICRKPVIESLEELKEFLQEPNSGTDAESCIALHTDQVALSEDLLQAAQNAGVAVYIPDKDKDIKSVLNASKAKGNYTSSDAPVADVAQEEAGSVRYLPLPGVRLVFKYITSRGVTLKGEYGIPRLLTVGEMVYLTILNADPSGEHAVVCGGGTEETFLKIDKKTVVVPIRSQNNQKGKQTMVQMEALQKGEFKLFLSINGEEFIIDMVIQEPPTAMPGVLIGCACEPENVFLPEELFLRDPLIRPIRAADLQEKYRDRLLEAKARLPQPWWLNASPIAASLRGIAFPPAETVNQSNQLVFSHSSLKESTLLREKRAAIRREQAEEKKRKRRRYKDEMTNRHMLHFGLDTSVPVKRPE
ncbi:hypothetical protein AGDE_09352 [Angomonas deanei]|nr:hypothetical protein AGDE_09352 [Angomonas deanei]|eukprot:EPY30620.1 hypothetical protein AGDE_09352 [Angomonas deanei]